MLNHYPRCMNIAGGVLQPVPLLRPFKAPHPQPHTNHLDLLSLQASLESLLVSTWMTMSLVTSLAPAKNLSMRGQLKKNMRNTLPPHLPPATPTFFTFGR